MVIPTSQMTSGQIKSDGFVSITGLTCPPDLSSVESSICRGDNVLSCLAPLFLLHADIIFLSRGEDFDDTEAVF